MHARRTLNVCLAVAVLVTAAAPAGARAAGLSRIEASFLRAVNTARLREHRAPVRLHEPLVRVAREHSAEMISTGRFMHGDFRRRLTATGVTGTVGENLGWSADDGQAQPRIMRMWLASPTHRAILLRPGFALVGVGVARGPFMGWPRAIVVTMDFDGN